MYLYVHIYTHVYTYGGSECLQLIVRESPLQIQTYIYKKDR